MGGTRRGCARLSQSACGSQSEKRSPSLHRLRGEHFDWAGVRMSVLWPDSSDPARAHNDDSLVLRLEDGKDSFLLTGDIERAVERSISGEWRRARRELSQSSAPRRQNFQHSAVSRRRSPRDRGHIRGRSQSLWPSQPRGSRANSRRRDAPVSHRPRRRHHRSYRRAIAGRSLIPRLVRVPARNSPLQYFAGRNFSRGFTSDQSSQRRLRI